MDKRESIDRLEEQARAAWNRSQDASVPEGWRDRVMRAVSGEAASPDQHAFQRALAWSSAVAACAAGALLLLVPAGNLQFTRELIRLVLLDPAGFLRNLPTGF